MKKIKKYKDNLNNLLTFKNITETSADLYFYGDIVSDWWGSYQDEDQYPESIRNFLNGVDNKSLNIHINSGGGAVFAGIAIYNMLKNYQNHKTVYIDGVAGSIASIIALAGDKIIMRKGSSIIIHKPLQILYGAYNANDLTKIIEDLSSVEKCIMQIYEENIKDDAKIEDIKQMVDRETILTGDEAINFFNVEIDGTNQAVACISDCIPQYLEPPDNKLELLNKKLELKRRLYKWE